VTGILLLHGGGHGPWCWEEFANRLTERGHDVRAVRLRGHDQRPGRIWHRVHDYLDDVRLAAAAFPEPPVLVGLPWVGCWRRSTWSATPPGRC
jgi:alpha-beta hydrolase superfamily lysophospholipase